MKRTTIIAFVKNLLLVASTISILATIIGNGPDYDAMIYFIGNYEDHYFGEANKIIAYISLLIGGPESYQLIVYIILALLSLIIDIKNKYLKVFFLIFATTVCTGNYRIGLASVLLLLVERTKFFSNLYAIPAVLIHYSAAPVYILKLISNAAPAKLFFIAILGYIGVVYFINELSFIEASIATHADQNVDIGANNILLTSLFYSAAFAILFKLSGDRDFLIGVVIALGGAIFEIPLFSRLLMYYKLKVFLPGVSDNNTLIYMRIGLGFIIAAAQLRNDYYWW